MRIDDEPGGGLRLTPARQGAAIVVAIVGALLLALSRLPEDRTLAFAASTTLVGLVMLFGAAYAGTTARTAALVRRLRSRGFIGTQPDDGGGSYREAPRKPLVLVDGEPLAGALRVEVRRDRAERGPSFYRVYIVGEKQLLPIDSAPDGERARALLRRLESALGLPHTTPDVEREFRFDAEPEGALLLAFASTIAYLALAFALSHWLFARPELIERREPIAPMILVPFGAICYGAWSKLGAAAACARLVEEFGLRR
ncbi:MAG TPA: hypothetical protein VGL86_16995 [Polyangia bacterium]